RADREEHSRRGIGNYGFWIEDFGLSATRPRSLAKYKIPNPKSKIMTTYGAIIAGTGHYLPEKRLTNDDLAKMVDTNDEWIVQRTGTRERRIAGATETTASLAHH